MDGVENVAMIKCVMYAREHAADLRAAFAAGITDFGAWRTAHPFTQHDDEIYRRFRSWMPRTSFMADGRVLHPAENRLRDAYEDRELWGPLSAFPDFESFTDGVTRRGVGGLEMLAMEMKATGTYVSRGLSYEQAEFELAQARARARRAAGLRPCGARR